MRVVYFIFSGKDNKGTAKLLVFSIKKYSFF